MARGRVFLFLGLALALIAGLAVYLVANQSRPQQVVMQDVVTAAVDIPARTFVTDDTMKTYFAVTKWPAALIPPGALVRPTDASSKVIVDRVAKGLPVLVTNLSNNKTTGQTGMSLDIPDGMVAESLSISDPNSVAGSISPGDFVDLLLSAPPASTQVSPTPVPSPGATPAPRRPDETDLPAPQSPLITQSVLQHVKVLAIGQKSAASASQQGGQTSNSAPTITLLLSHQDALVVKYLKDGGGQYDVVLRRYDDAKGDVVTVPVTRGYLDDKYNFLGKVVPTPTPAGTAAAGAIPSATPSPAAKPK